MKEVIKSTQQKTAQRTAFSLIEISIVILVIGVIIAGTIKASSIYGKYQVTTARNLTNTSPVHSISDLLVWYETTSESSFKDEEAQNYNDLTSAEQTLGMGLISTWYDVSSNGGPRLNATQSTGSAKPQYHLDCINGLPCVKFDGTNDYLEISSTVNLDGSEYTIFVVDKKDSSGTEPYLFFGPKEASSGDDAVAIGYDSSTKVLFSHGDTTNYYTISGPSASDPPSIHTFVGAFENSLLTTSVYHILNGSSTYSTLGETGSPSFTAISGSATSRLGSGYNESTETFFKGNIGELIIFQRALTATERKSVEEYLQKKWKISAS